MTLKEFITEGLPLLVVVGLVFGSVGYAVWYAVDAHTWEARTPETKKCEKMLKWRSASSFVRSSSQARLGSETKVVLRTFRSYQSFVCRFDQGVLQKAVHLTEDSVIQVYPTMGVVLAEER